MTTSDTAASHATTTTPHPTYVLVSETPRVTQDQLAIIALAITKDQQTFGARWGVVPAVVHAAGRVQDAPPGATVVRVREATTVPNAIAWHSEDADGRIIIEVAVSPVLDNGGGVLDGGSIAESVASAIDHEAKEARIDPSVNLWADRFDGTEVAYESCDPVQGDLLWVDVTYKGSTHKVGLSNYVCPAWFDAQAASGSRLDAVGTTTAPLHLASGGYMVLRRVGKDLPQEFGRAAHTAYGAASLDHGEDVGVVFGPAVPEWKRKRAMKRVQARLHGHGPRGPRHVPTAE